MRPHRLTTVVALGYIVVLLLIAFWPTHVDEGIDVVNWWPVQWLGDLFDLNIYQRYDLIEFGSNIILFIPLGLVASRQLRSRPFVVPIIGGFLVSSFIELGQLILWLDRTASISDVLANTLGTIIGVAMHRTVSAHISRKKLLVSPASSSSVSGCDPAEPGITGSHPDEPDAKSI